MSISKQDDFMFQENYIVEFSEEIAEQIRGLDNFTFDFVFDETGMAGIFNSQQIKKELLFRVFNLPLPTEIYTSSDGSFYYKNSDLSQIIYVYESDRAPQIFRDYQEFMLAQASLSLRQHPFQFNVQPHGLTPPTRFAPFNLYPQVPIRPRFLDYPEGPEITQLNEKPKSDRPTTRRADLDAKAARLKQMLDRLRSNAQKAGQTTNERIRSVEQYIAELEQEIAQQRATDERTYGERTQNSVLQ